MATNKKVPEPVTADTFFTALDIFKKSIPTSKPDEVIVIMLRFHAALGQLTLPNTPWGRFAAGIVQEYNNSYTKIFSDSFGPMLTSLWEKYDAMKRSFDDLLKKFKPENAVAYFGNLVKELNAGLTQITLTFKEMCKAEQAGSQYARNQWKCFASFYRGDVSIFDAYTSFIRVNDAYRMRIPNVSFTTMFPISYPMEKAHYYILPTPVCNHCKNPCLVAVNFCDLECENEKICWSCFREIAWSFQHDDKVIFPEKRDIKCPSCMDNKNLVEFQSQIRISVHLNEDQVTKPRKKRGPYKKKDSSPKRLKRVLTSQGESPEENTGEEEVEQLLLTERVDLNVPTRQVGTLKVP